MAENTIPIRIKINTYDELKEIGNFGETYDDIIKRLLKNKKGGKQE